MKKYWIDPIAKLKRCIGLSAAHSTKKSLFHLSKHRNFISSIKAYSNTENLQFHYKYIKFSHSIYWTEFHENLPYIVTLLHNEDKASQDSFPYIITVTNRQTWYSNRVWIKSPQMFFFRAHRYKFILHPTEPLLIFAFVDSISNKIGIASVNILTGDSTCFLSPYVVNIFFTYHLFLAPNKNKLVILQDLGTIVTLSCQINAKSKRLEIFKPTCRAISICDDSRCTDVVSHRLYPVLFIRIRYTTYIYNYAMHEILNVCFWSSSKVFDVSLDHKRPNKIVFSSLWNKRVLIVRPAFFSKSLKKEDGLPVRIQLDSYVSRSKKITKKKYLQAGKKKDFNYFFTTDSAELHDDIEVCLGTQHHKRLSISITKTLKHSILRSNFKARDCVLSFPNCEIKLHPRAPVLLIFFKWITCQTGQTYDHSIHKGIYLINLQSTGFQKRYSYNDVPIKNRLNT